MNTIDRTFLEKTLDSPFLVEMAAFDLWEKNVFQVWEKKLQVDTLFVGRIKNKMISIRFIFSTMKQYINHGVVPLESCCNLQQEACVGSEKHKIIDKR